MGRSTQLVLSFAVAVVALGSAMESFAMKSYAMKRYGALPEQSSWRMVKTTPIECRMQHDVPLFGSASFTSRASKKMNLHFLLDMYVPMGKTGNVSLISMPAPWMSGEPAVYLEQLRFYKQFNGYIDGQAAWNMLSELEKGNFPTFNYQEWQSNNKEVSVYLSAIGFKKPYSEFRHCISKLLPYSFEDIAFTTLHYTENGESLSKIAKKKLVQISEYIRHNQNIELILMSAYSDSRGTQKENVEITKNKAKQLEDYLISLGIAKERIQVQAFGESRPVAVNETIKGRNLNRRVVIALTKNVF